MKQPIVHPEQQARLARVIAEVEQNTAGEIVVAILHRSNGYWAYRLAFAAVFGVLAAGIATWFLPWLTAVFSLGLELLTAALVLWATKCAAVLRCIVPEAARRLAVSERAKILFIERGVTETRDRSGILILLSALEKRVEILGDRGIYEHLGASTWATLVNQLTVTIAAGRAADGLEALIVQLGERLAEHFPPRSDDENELANQVVTD